MNDIEKRREFLGAAVFVALAVTSAFLSGCPKERPRPPEMDLTTAELNATPLSARMFDPDQLTLHADADQVHGAVPLEVRFRVRSLDDTWKPRYVWNFGDGSALSVERYPTHVYRRPGVYKATVRVTDEQNKKVGVDEVEIIVLEEEP